MPLSARDIVIPGADGRSWPAFEVVPEVPDPPGIVVIHEIWGVERHIRAVCERLSREGYRVVAPNLLGMDVTLSPATFMAAYRAVQALPPEERAVAARVDAALEVVPAGQRDEVKHLMAVAFMGAQAEGLLGVQVAVDFLRAHGSRRVGVMGFCIGGAYTWAHGLAGGTCEALAPFYGRLPQAYDPARVRAPLEGHYGANDHGIPLEPIQEAAEAICGTGGEAVIHVYEGAGHAFFNDTRDTFVPEAASLAWDRLLAFMGRNLR